MTGKENDLNENSRLLGITGWAILGIELVMSALLIALVIRTGLLPALYTVIACVGLAALLVIMWLLIRKNSKRIRYFIGTVISLILSIIMVIGSLAVSNVTDTLQTITDSTEETTRMGVYVRADDSAEDIEDAKLYTFGILESIIREDSDNTIAQIEEELDLILDVAEFEGISDLADALLDGECDAMIISEDFVDILTEVEGYEDFDDEVKEIASYEWTESVTLREEDDDDAELEDEDGIFTMYISGIDTYGAVSTRSRSDVNIIAVVNTNTKQVLLVSTPRDYYVELSISNGVKDKLTHAGIYGVSVSVDTLEMLYDMEIDYYFRINFTGFEELIDALGGITVYSEYSFTVEPDFVYVQGYNELSGIEALAFARERYSFSSGDRQRGKNQMAVIEGVINKLQTTAILKNFSSILDGLEGSFETNMPYSELAALVKQQLYEGGSWDVVSYSVDGTGTYSTTYSINQSLYVMVPDESTVAEAKELINSVLANEVVSSDE